MKGRENWGTLRRWWAFQWFKLVRVLKKVVRSNSTSHSIALGNSIGFFIAFLPCIGIQMALSVLISTIFRANRIASILPCWITNPATMIPVYAFNYWLGYIITGWGPDKEEFTKALEEAKRVTEQSGFFDGIVDGTKAMLHFGPWAFASLVIGSAIVGLVLAVATYPLVLALVNRVRRLRERRREQRAERVRLHMGGLLSRLKGHHGADGENKEGGTPPQS